MSRGLYNVERESAVQDAKLMDISIAVPGVGRVPIEIKPLYASRYSLPQLQAFIAIQLVARYMRPPAVDRGIFLLVPLKLRTWRDGKQVLSFDDLCVKLQDHANRVGAKAYKEVQVMCINVAAARRSKPAAARAGKTPPRAARSAKPRGPRSPKPGRSKRAPLPIAPKGSARR